MYRGDIYGVIFRVDSISEVKMTIKPSFEAVQTAPSHLLDDIVFRYNCGISLYFLLIIPADTCHYLPYMSSVSVLAGEQV